MLISRAQQRDKSLLVQFLETQKVFAEKGNQNMVDYMQMHIQWLREKIKTHDYSNEEEVLKRQAERDRMWNKLCSNQNGGTMKQRYE